MERPGKSEIELVRVAGPPMETVRLDSNALIGRGRDCNVLLLDEHVSRAHAAITRRGGRWVIEDQGSRSGTFLNGVALKAEEVMALAPGDLISIGPWTVRVSGGGEATTAGSTIHSTTVRVSDAEDGAPRVRAVERRADSRLAEAQLGLLMDCVGRVVEGPTAEELHGLIVEAALSGAGFARAALLRPGEGDVFDVLAFACRDGSDATTVRFSRSLLRRAGEGRMVELTEASEGAYGESVAELEITAAVCAPVIMGTTPTAFLYLDARRGDAGVGARHGAFCEALARVCAMALGNLQRAELERRSREIEVELGAAREAQRLIMAPAEGVIGGISYACATRPGRYVAGDLFDVLALGDERVAVVLGDVTGEGLDAAVVMAATQSHLHAALRRGVALGEAVASANEYLCERSAANRFVTLWAGIFDSAEGTLRYVDAGHGHWLVRRGGAGAFDSPGASAIPLSISPGMAFEAREMALRRGDRVVLYSDGITEQASPSGEQFGKARLIEALRGSGDAAGDVRAAMEALTKFAQRERWDDDASVASVGFGGA
ncbi:MAG: SpoIIE family protein phosphatase [Planctomycetota bacterium]|nr:SpoIIE family protein phosphatase [Planctomycetota bacterium]